MTQRAHQTKRSPAADHVRRSLEETTQVHLREHLSHFPKHLQRALAAVEMTGLPMNQSRLTPSKRDAIGGRVLEGSAPSTTYRPNTKLQPAQISALIEGYEEGVSMEQLGRYFGVHAHTVRHHLGRAEVVLRPRRAADERQIEGIVQLYRTGLSLRQVSAQAGLSYGSVRNYLLRAAVALRPPVRPTQRDPG
ncbi:MAG: helix-turn-helix domain containing protein [Frankiales bacterium]|nr:helix-turn-helix domain containing protein [Frankiales bacterium]